MQMSLACLRPLCLGVSKWRRKGEQGRIPRGFVDFDKMLGVKAPWWVLSWGLFILFRFEEGCCIGASEQSWGLDLGGN